MNEKWKIRITFYGTLTILVIIFITEIIKSLKH